MFYLLSLVLIFPAFAADWLVNKDHSKLEFQVPYLQISEVSGRFNQFIGHVEINDKDIATRLLLKISSDSIDTGNSLRDGHLKGNDFLQIKKHPFIIFTSKNISKIKANQYRVNGELLIKNKLKPLTIGFSLSETIKDTWGFKNKFIKFSAQINRKDFDLQWNKTLEGEKYLVGDVVSLNGTFQLQPSSSKTPSSKHMIPDTGYIRYREQINRGERVERIPTEAVFVAPLKNQKNLKKEEALLASVPKKEVDNYRDSGLWWTAIWVLGLMGFLSIIILSYYIKTSLSEYFPSKYQENGKLGVISDLIVILLVMIYSISFWILGWGAH